MKFVSNKAVSKAMAMQTEVKTVFFGILFAFRKIFSGIKPVYFEIFGLQAKKIIFHQNISFEVGILKNSR